MDASVIIPARDAVATLGATLAALAAQEGTFEFEVIVVDDGSRDATAELVRACASGGHAGGPEFRLVAGAGEGPARARNRGAAVARGAVLAFTDADCEPTPGWLAALLAAAAAGADLVQGKVLPPPGVTFGPFDRWIAVVSEYGLYETANLAVRREAFERLGGFESILQPRNGKELGEDVWLGWRARRAGCRIVFCDDALVHHVVFSRGPAEYVAEQARVRYFPALAERIPELREVFFYRRWFLSRRSALFDLALVGLALCALSRRPAPLLLLAPYARELRREARNWPQVPAATVVAAGAARDALGAGALVLGSIRARTPVL